MALDTEPGSSPPILVAARMSSARLPGKMLMEFGGRPLLSHVVDAVSAAEGTGQVVVVTSQDSSDDPIVQWCEANRTDVWRGELNDVARRMLAAAQHIGATSFVRISGDSPMIDPQIISFAVRRFAESLPDLVTNVRPRTFPAGQSVEVVRTQTLERLLACDACCRPEEREHVTTALYRHEKEINIERFTPSDLQSRNDTWCGPYKSMTVDTPADANCFHLVIRNANDSSIWRNGWERCEALMRCADQQLRFGPGI